MPSKRKSDELIAQVTSIAESLFEDKEAAERWMSTPNIALGGDIPSRHARTELGAQNVRRVLNAIEWGGVS